MSDRPYDELILQHLGAAVMLCWGRLPIGARDQILRQADDVIGLEPIPEIRNEITKLLLRHAKAQWAASLLTVSGIRSHSLSFSTEVGALPEMSALQEEQQPTGVEPSKV